MFKRLAQGISRTRNSLLDGLKSVLGKKTTLDTGTIEALESSLLIADCGIDATQRIIDGLKSRGTSTDHGLIDTVVEEMTDLLKTCEAPLAIPPGRKSPFVILIVGVNGAGKTTTIAKIGRRLTESGLSVMFAAGDTFRAAAVEQLNEWGRRLDIPVVAQSAGADPASVIFDACSAAMARRVDVLLADTAGRLHTQSNLMAELEKVKRVIKKFDVTAPHETMLVLDATMGQNALSQATLFHEQIELDSIVLTKLDGTAKGGILFALAAKLGLPIRFIGIGEGYDDLQPFVAKDFAEAILADAPIESVESIE
jgi:fused signal recognition particle receptor